MSNPTQLTSDLSPTSDENSLSSTNVSAAIQNLDITEVHESKTLQIEKDELLTVNATLEPELQGEDTRAFVLSLLDSSFELNLEEKKIKSRRN